MLHIKTAENRPYILKIRIAKLPLISHISMFLLQSKHQHGANRGTGRHIPNRTGIHDRPYAYPLTGILTITTDNGSELSAHQEITRGLKGVVVYFANTSIKALISLQLQPNSSRRYSTGPTDGREKIKNLHSNDRVFQTFLLILHLHLDSAGVTAISKHLNNIYVQRNFINL